MLHLPYGRKKQLKVKNTLSNIIHLLPDNIANKIAAGEVVIRPAAAVKELLENAIDSGATEIKLLVKDGGKSLVQVIDNGCGMSDVDARMSFERHATSKIKQIDDLFAIRTMGFRGEALASIAAVSKVELKSRLHDEELGCKIVIEGSEVKSQEPCQCAAGTSISVKSLFYNVPARRKFLKADSTETKHIYDEFVRISLSHPNIRFSFFNDDKEVYLLPAQNLRQRISALFGKKYNERLVPVGEDTDIIKVNGFIGKPEHAKRTKGEQFFFVNGRFIRSGYLHHAVMQAFDPYIAVKQHPLYVLNLEVDPNSIDINIHPSKHEVKFEDERSVYSIVNAAVKHALNKFNVTPTLDFDADPAFNRHEFFANPLEKRTVIDNPVRAKGNSTFMQRHQDVTGGQTPEDWERAYKFSPEELKRLESIENAPKEGELMDEDLAFKPFQIHNKYIISRIKQGFILVDQRRAHQRILFETFINASETGHYPKQKMLFPQNVAVSAADANVIKEHKDKFETLGFEIEPFGKDTFIVHATPSDVKIEDIQATVDGLLESLKINKTEEQLDERQRMARQLAIYGSMRHGERLSIREMQELIDRLFACTQPQYGIRKDFTFITYDFDSLEKAFSI